MAYQRKYMIGVVASKIESKKLEIATAEDKLTAKVEELLEFRSDVVKKATNAAGRIEVLTSGIIDLRDDELWRQLSEAIKSMPNPTRWDTGMQDLERVLANKRDELAQLESIQGVLVTSTGDTLSVQTAKDLGLAPLVRYTGR